jgi:hypothetical protein
VHHGARDGVHYSSAQSSVWVLTMNGHVHGHCSVQRSVTAQQAGLDLEDDTERTVSTVTRHETKPQENPQEDLPYLEPTGAVCVQPQLSVAQHC